MLKGVRIRSCVATAGGSTWCLPRFQMHGALILLHPSWTCRAPLRRLMGKFVAGELLSLSQPEYSYLPFFYSREFSLSWQVRWVATSHVNID